MYKKINKFIFISIFALLFLIPFKANAFQITDNQTVDINKIWTIKFTGDVGFDDFTKSAITVTDSKGNNVNITISQGSDSKTLLVNAPNEGYTPGEFYTLTIDAKAHSIKGENLKKERILHFNIKSVNPKVITKVMTYEGLGYQYNNYDLPKTVTIQLADGSTKEANVKWDHDCIDGSTAGDFTYYGTVDGTNIKSQAKFTIKSMKTINDLQDYLNYTYKSIDSPISKLNFEYTIEQNDYDLYPYDLRIKTKWNPLEFSPFDLEHSIKISDEDKKKTIDLLKDLQRRMASDCIRYCSGKKIEGGFFDYGYEYPNIHAGYYTIPFLTWINYDYDVVNASNYNNTHVTNFQWFNLYDDYNFTGEAKRTR